MTTIINHWCVDRSHYGAMQEHYSPSSYLTWFSVFIRSVMRIFAVICLLTLAEQTTFYHRCTARACYASTFLPQWHTTFQRGSKDFHDVEGRRFPFSSAKPLSNGSRSAVLMSSCLSSACTTTVHLMRRNSWLNQCNVYCTRSSLKRKELQVILEN